MRFSILLLSNSNATVPLYVYLHYCGIFKWTFILDKRLLIVANLQVCTVTQTMDVNIRNPRMRSTTWTGNFSTDKILFTLTLSVQLYFSSYLSHLVVVLSCFQLACHLKFNNFLLALIQSSILANTIDSKQRTRLDWPLLPMQSVNI